MYPFLHIITRKTLTARHYRILKLKLKATRLIHFKFSSRSITSTLQLICPRRIDMHRLILLTVSVRSIVKFPLIHIAQG